MSPEIRLTASTPGHDGAVAYRYGGMGNPGTYEVTCTCGWAGYPWDELYTDLDEPLAKHGFTPAAIREFETAGGLRGWNAAHPATRAGNLPQAAGELLNHLGITVADAAQAAGEQRAAAGQALAAALDAGAGDSEEEWRASAASVDAALKALNQAVRAEKNLAKVVVDTRIGLP